MRRGLYSSYFNCCPLPADRDSKRVDFIGYHIARHFEVWLTLETPIIIDFGLKEPFLAMNRSYFGDTPHRARKGYYSYVEAGLDQGRRNELTGGGLIRSLGRWTEVRKYGLKGQDHIKSDERILGESDFVADVISLANEKFERKYELKRLGYDLDQVAASAYVLGHVLSRVVDEAPHEKDVEALFRKAWEAKNRWAEKLIVTDNCIAENVFRTQAEKNGLSFEIVPLSDLEAIVGPLKELFASDFIGTAT